MGVEKGVTKQFYGFKTLEVFHFFHSIKWKSQSPVYLFKIVFKVEFSIQSISSHITKNLTESVSIMSSIFRVISPSLKKTLGLSFCAFREFENIFALLFSKLKVSWIDMYVLTSY